LGLTERPTMESEQIVPPRAYGVACVSMGFFVGEDQPVMWRGPMLHKALEQFLVDVAWGEPDYLLIDMPPGTGDVALSMAQYLPRSEFLVVTTPQAAAQRVAQKTAYMARKLKLPLRGVIENMSWFTGDDGKRYELFGAGGGHSLADELGVPLLGQIPLVPAVREGGDVGVPVVVSDGEGEAARAIRAVAGRVAEMGPARIYRSELKVR
ncbi:MAG TPA: P-loop NTPase, partial [Acidimicrobiales bacterium]|nr:P-loop NTPase [Acidimicrobiales bacterium]